MTKMCFVPHWNNYLKFFIFTAGTTAVTTPNPIPYLNDPRYGYGGLGSIVLHIPSGQSSAWNDYVGLWVTLIIVTVLASVVSAAIKYKLRKKMQAKIQHGMPMEKWLEPLYTGWDGHGVPPPATYDPPHIFQPTV